MIKTGVFVDFLAFVGDILVRKFVLIIRLMDNNAWQIQVKIFFFQ